MNNQVLRIVHTGCILLITIFAYLFVADVSIACAEDGDKVAGKDIANLQEIYDDTIIPEISATSVALVSADGTIYFERNIHEEAKIASLTKIMTFLVARQYQSSVNEIVVDAKSAKIDGSSAGLKAGDLMSFQDACIAMLVASGNDAASALAQNIGQSAFDADTASAQEVFVQEMNNYAQKLGMTHTVFSNPHGLDEDEYKSNAHSTAHDVLRMLDEALKDDLFREIIAMKNPDIALKHADGTREKQAIISTDELLKKSNELIGGKTGTTNLAGFCFTFAFNIDNNEYHGVILNAASSDERFNDADKLITWIKDHILSQSFIQTNYFDDNSAPILAEIPHSQWPGKVVQATVEDPHKQISYFEYGGEITQHCYALNLHGDIHKGDEIGLLEINQDGNVIGTYPLYALNDCDKPNIFEALGISFDRFIRKFTNVSATMPITCYNMLDA